MNIRILTQTVSLSLLVCGAARAEDVAVEPVTATEACNVIEDVVQITSVEPEISVCSEEPEIIVCPGVIEIEDVVTKPEVEEPEVVYCVGLEGELGEVRHYSGSEVERGGGDVDPVMLYSTGVVTLGGGETGMAVLGQEASATGIAAVASLKVDIAELVSPVRELQVLDTAGDIIISD
jgi:hypothetical protein